MNSTSQIQSRLRLLKLTQLLKALLEAGIGVTLLLFSLPYIWRYLPQSAQWLRFLLAFSLVWITARLVQNLIRILRLSPTEFAWQLEARWPRQTYGCLSASLANATRLPLNPVLRQELEERCLKALREVPNMALWPRRALLSLSCGLLLLLGAGIITHPQGFKGPMIHSRILAALLMRGQLIQNLQIRTNSGPHLALRTVTVEGVAHGLGLHPVRVEARDDSGRLLQSTFATLQTASDGKLNFKAELKQLEGSLTLQAFCGAAVSNSLQIKLLDPLTIVHNSIRVEYPEVLDMPPQTRTALKDPIPVNSHVEHRVNYSRPPVKTQHKPSQVDLRTSIQDHTSVHSLVATTSLTYQVLASDVHGFEVQNSLTHIPVVSDTSPELTLLQPESRQIRVQAGPHSGLDLKLEARDDFGLKSLRYVLLFKQQFEMTFMSLKREGSLALSSQTTRFRFQPEFRPIHLQPGDKASLRLYLSDKNPETEDAAITDLILFVPLHFEKLAELENETQAQTQKARETLAMQSRLGKLEEGLMGNLKNPSQLGKSQKEQFQKALKMREELASRVQKLEEELDATLNSERNREEKLLDTSALRKMQKIRNLFTELNLNMQNDLSRMREMSRSMEGLSPQDMQKMLQSFDPAKFEEEMDRAIENLEQLKEQQALQKNLARLKHLKQEQENILQSEAMGQDVSGERQSAVETGMQSFFDEMQKMLESSRMEKTVRAPLQQQLQKSREKFEQASANQDRGGQLQAMRQMQAAMEHALAESEQKSMTISLKKLFVFLRETHHISSRLQWLKTHLESFSGMMLKRKAARELSFVDTAMENLKTDMAREYKQNLSFQSAVLDLSRILKEKLAEGVQLYGSDGQIRSTHPILAARNTANQINGLLLNLIEKMQNQQEQSQSSQNMESLSQLQKRQRDLNQKTQRLKGRPMSPGMRRKMLKQMALEQQMIRQSTEALRRKMQRKAELARELQKARSSMQKLEKKLASEDRLSDESRQLQEEIDARLMEAEKVRQKQDEESKTRREAKAHEGEQVLQKGLQNVKSNQDSWIGESRSENLPSEFLGIIEQYRQMVE